MGSAIPERIMDAYQKKRRIIEVALAILVAFVLVFAEAYPTKTADLDLSLPYLTVGIAEGTLAIDTAMAHYGYSADSLRVEGKTYISSPPGLAYVASVPYRIVYGSELPPLLELLNFLNRWVGIPLALLCFVTLRRVLKLTHVDGPGIDVASLVFAVGTPMMAQGTTLNADVFLALLLLLALRALLTLETKPLSGIVGTLMGFGAGAAMGWACMSHIMGWLLALLFVIYAITGTIRHHRPALVSMLVATGLGLAMSLYLTNLITGSPFAAPAVEGWKSHLIMDLISTQNGLFFTAPILVFWPIGAGVLWRRGLRRLSIFTIVGPILWLIGAYQTSTGLFAYPVALVFMAFAIGHLMDVIGQMPTIHGLTRGLSVMGIVVTLGVFVSLAESPLGATDGVWEVLSNAYATGVFAPNLGKSLLGLEGNLTVLPLGLVGVLLAVFVAVRGLDDLPKKSQKIAASVITLLVTLASLALVTHGAGQWTAKEEKDFIKNSNPLKQQQNGLRKGMNKVIHDVDGL